MARLIMDAMRPSWRGIICPDCAAVGWTRERGWWVHDCEAGTWDPLVDWVDP